MFLIGILFSEVLLGVRADGRAGLRRDGLDPAGVQHRVHRPGALPRQLAGRVRSGWGLCMACLAPLQCV